MAVYNVEPFLREAIDSVIGQDIGFENIQLILVDDGSPDGSGAICDEYAQMYPKNVTVIHKENGGQANARVDGIRVSCGKYISFLDPDDILDTNSFSNMVSFFEAHYEETDVVAMPIYMFGTQTGPHPSNRKFGKGTRVINLEAEYDCIQLGLASVLVKNEVSSIIGADSEIVTAEDAKELLKVLLVKRTIGVVAEAAYHYRKRGDSTVGGAQSRKGWYNVYLEHFPQYIFNYCLEKCGEIPKFIQFTVMYDLQWKIRPQHIPEGVLTKEEASAYREKLFEVISYIDDEIIWKQRQLNVEQKLYLVQRKNPSVSPQIFPHAEGNSPFLMFNGIAIRPINQFQMHLNHCIVFEDRLELDGMLLIPTAALGEPQIIICANNRQIIASPNGYDNSIYSVDIPIAVRRGFHVTIPLCDSCTQIRFQIQYGAFAAFQENIVLGKFFPVSKHIAYSHYYHCGMMMYPQKNGLRIQKISPFSACKLEFRYLTHLLHSKSISAKHAFAARVMYYILRPFVPKNLWLITDKADRADDNGEAFFLYCTQHQKSLDCYPVFAVGKDSPDYARLKKCGKVIPYMSRQHKLYHLLAKHTISAYSHDEISAPFFDYAYYYCDLLQSNKVVFLQHGITKDDVSQSLNWNHKNFAMFVTSTLPEYQSILDCNYGYTSQQVALTGLPRYDRLYDDNQNKITIMPTWRRKLFGTYDASTSKWSLLPGFEESDFYQFYSNLLNSETLHAAAKNYGYEIQFLIHPTLFPYLDHFELDDRVVILKSDAVYRDVFVQSSLILTDYSSVAFDIAYLKKPVVYTHFDSNHYAEGYFDYERDGFGEVEYTLEATVDRIIEYMENGCQLKDKYRQRIDSFFAFNDKNNCQRVYEKIIELDERNASN